MPNVAEKSLWHKLLDKKVSRRTVIQSVVAAGVALPGFGAELDTVRADAVLSVLSLLLGSAEEAAGSTGGSTAGSTEGAAPPEGAGLPGRAGGAAAKRPGGPAEGDEVASGKRMFDDPVGVAR